MDEYNPRECDRETPTIRLDLGGLQLSIGSNLVVVVGVDLNVLEILRIINHIQHEALFDASEYNQRPASRVTYMIVKRNH